MTRPDRALPRDVAEKSDLKIARWTLVVLGSVLLVVGAGAGIMVYRGLGG